MSPDVYPLHNILGGASGPNVVDDVACTGNEASLSYCSYSLYDYSEDSLTRYAGVRCLSGEYLITAKLKFFEIKNGDIGMVTKIQRQDSYAHHSK